jgi:polyhydroxybutyrate depolymerase
MRRLSVFPALVTMVAAACADSVTAPRQLPVDASSSISAAAAPANVPGTARRTLTIGGQQREFYVHVGRNVPPNAPVPVVFFFHGSGSNGLEHLRSSRWREKADTVGFIAIFPSALAYCFKEDDNNDGDMLDSGEVHAGAKWTSGPLGGPTRPLCQPADYLKLNAKQRRATRHPFQDDTTFVDAMIADIKATNLIDTKRLYLTGFSNGAEMVSRLLVERSYVFAAVAMHAGTLDVPIAPFSSRRVPILKSMGNKNDQVPVGMPGHTLPIAAATIDLPFMQRDYVVRYLQQELLANQYTFGVMIWNRRQVGRWVYNTGLFGNTNPFVFLLIENNGHAYPNGVNHVVTMADRAWPFLAANPMP